MTTIPLSDETAATALGLRVEEIDESMRDRYARGIWSCLTEPGDGVAGALIAAFGAREALTIVDIDDPLAGAAAGVDAKTLAQARSRWRPRRGDVRRAFDAARRCGAQLITPADAAWPQRVDDLGIHAPVCLWVRGDASLLPAHGGAVAIVGSRAASSYGEHVAMELAADLAGSGVMIVSGAAYGIDGAAHRATLTAGGTTLAVLAGGIDRPYPAGHTDLLSRVVRSGVVVAEVPCGTAPTKWRFLSRNRLIAAMSDATVVVEAGWRSGSLNTAHHAADLSRPMGAVPGPVTSASSMGCHRLLRETEAHCITRADDVRELMGLDARIGAVDAGARTDERTRVRDALSTRGGRTTDDIARRSGLSPSETGAVLALLELSGEVERRGEAWRRRPAS